MIETDVIIVGAGPAGLSLAIELGRRGRRVTVLEQNARVGQNPRAKTTNVRTMEHVRRWGIADKVRAAAPLPLDYPRNVVFATRLYGYPLGKIENGLFTSPQGDARYSEPSQWIPQYKLEEVLRAHAVALPTVTLRFNARIETATDADTTVTATVVDTETNATDHYRGHYLVGADGARSRIRSLIGAKMEGDHGLTTFMGAVFHAPGLIDSHTQERGFMYLLANASGTCLIGPMDHGDLWFWISPVPRDATMTEAEARQRITAAIGADVPFEIKTFDPWLAHRLIADHYTRGRMFLIGDACHLHPPFGGYGMNMGIADGVDLGWKIAAVLDGWGGPSLLATYESERRPVHRRVIDEAIENMSFFAPYFQAGHLEQATPEGEDARAGMSADLQRIKIREFRGLGVMLGYTYAGSPTVIGDGRAPPPEHPLYYTPSASPGCRAPHVWLGADHSLFDTFGDGLTLLVTANDVHGATVADDIARLQAAAKTLGVPLTVSAPSHPDLEALYGARFALIRPDQHVAWRGDTINDDARLILDTVRGR
jgi:2-polyprenyl-6-methoxyphenol hydroxylase-like FAD-dependent oxidoreductase